MHADTPIIATATSTDPRPPQLTSVRREVQAMTAWFVPIACLGFGGFATRETSKGDWITLVSVAAVRHRRW